jgi:hypothetical protein
MRWSAAEALAWVMRRDRRDLGSWTPDMGPEIEGAQKELAKAIGTGVVRAWGRRERDDPEQQIPSSEFRHTGLVVDVTGELVTSRPHRHYHGHRLKWIEFEGDEIKEAWPTPPPPNAEQWMLDEAKRLKAGGQMGKRDDLIQRCMDEAKCTRREALEAYKRLPDDMRRPRGKPAKHLAGFDR